MKTEVVMSREVAIREVVIQRNMAMCGRELLRRRGGGGGGVEAVMGMGRGRERTTRIIISLSILNGIVLYSGRSARAAIKVAIHVQTHDTLTHSLTLSHTHPHNTWTHRQHPTHRVPKLQSLTNVIKQRLRPKLAEEEEEKEDILIMCTESIMKFPFFVK